MQTADTLVTMTVSCCLVPGVTRLLLILMLGSGVHTVCCHLGRPVAVLVSTCPWRVPLSSVLRTHALGRVSGCVLCVVLRDRLVSREGRRPGELLALY